MSQNRSPLVVSIIVHYRTPGKCIELVNELQRIEYSNHKLVIVDNQSDEESYRLLQSSLSENMALLVRNNANNGYGGGINFGVDRVRYLQPDFFHIINCDTHVLNVTYISSLVREFAQNPTIGLIGPGVVTGDDEIQNTIMPFVSVFNALMFRYHSNCLSVIDKSPQLYQADVINGVCFMVRASAFYQAGGFEEDFFMYGEEHDLCFRLKQEGYSSFFWSGKAIYHDNGHVQQKKVFTWRDSLIRCNQVLFLLKHKTKVEAYLLSLLFICSLIIKKASGTKFPDFNLKTVIWGMLYPKAINNKVQSR